MAQSSPYWDSIANKVDFIVNGWITNPGVGGYGAAAIQQSPSASFTDVAAYNGGWEIGFLAGGTDVSDQGFQDTLLFPAGFMKSFVDRHVATRDLLASQGVTYDIAVYEGGPGYSLPGPGQEFNPVAEAYGKSLAGGVSILDAYLYNSSQRIDPQAFFHFGAGYNWASHARENVGHLPHTSWLALRMRNRHASGPMVETFINAAPTVDLPALPPDGSLVPAAPNTPLIQAHAFRDGDAFAVFLISRDLNHATPVTLRLPFDSAASATLHPLTGDPRENNADGLRIWTSEEMIADPVSGAMQLTLPPSAVYLYVFQGTSVTASDRPTVTISRALGQPDATARAGVRFSVFFDRPVTGFDAEDVVIHSNAGDLEATVREMTPANGMRYEVFVTGLVRDGNVAIEIAAGAAVDLNGQPSLAPVGLDTDVAFAWPLPQNGLYAYDGFDYAPTNQLHFLQGVSSGFGWAYDWQAHNYNPATYLDGYKLGEGGSMTFGDLETGGLHAVGGRQFELCERILDPEAFGHVTVFESDPPQIGQTGSDLWVSALLRKDTDDGAPVLFTLANGTFFGDYNRIDVGVGFYGDQSTVNGVRYWTLAVRNATDDGTDFLVTDAPVIIGEPALLVLHLEFGDTDTVRLYVNPDNLGGVAPASPDIEFTTTGETDLRFQSARFFTGLRYGHWNGDGHNQASFDEIRFGDSFGAVTLRQAGTSLMPGLMPSARVRPDGRIELMAAGEPNARYILQASEDLQSWTPLRSFLGSGGATPIVDPEYAAGAPKRFYRFLREE